MGWRTRIFDWGAIPYDYMTRHPYWREHIRGLMEHFPQGQGRTVLDLGCGPGVSALVFKREQPSDTVVGLDISAPMLERAKLHDPERICGWVRGDGHGLPLPDASVAPSGENAND